MKGFYLHFALYHSIAHNHHRTKGAKEQSLLPGLYRAPQILDKEQTPYGKLRFKPFKNVPDALEVPFYFRKE